MSVQKADAIALVRRWLSESGMELDVPGGVRVDHDAVRRGPEGWEVPWDNVDFLDGGDQLKRIFPPPRMIVTEPEGELRMANTTPHPGFSAPVQWPGEPRYTEIIDSEYRNMGLHGIGVPRNAVAGWKVEHPDGRTEEKPNPDYRVGPERAGLPRSQNPLEALLNYHHIQRISRHRFLAGLLRTAVLAPLGAGEDVLVEDGPRVRVYSSPRKIPKALRWLRMTVPTFVARFPGTALVINAESYVTTEVTAAELAEISAEFPGFAPEDPQVVAEIGPDGSLAAGAQELQRRFGLAEPPALENGQIVAARASGYDLTGQERQRLLLGQAWCAWNGAVRLHRPGSADDVSAQRWPADLHANGLVARHDDAGRVRPEPTTFGKFPATGASDLHRSWHAVVGAYTGFALGDALGSAVDGMSLEQIQARYGRRGIRGLEPAFDRDGQVSWRTQLLLFLTEAAIRGMRYRAGGADITTSTRSAHARWLAAQGEPWPQEAAGLARDGMLAQISELRFRRGVPDGLLEAVRRAIADPAADTGLHGPITLLWALPAAVADRRVSEFAAGWHRTPQDAAAADALGDLLQHLFLAEKFVNPTWMQIEELLQTGFRDPADEPAQRVRAALTYVSERKHRFLDSDREQLEGLGNGQDTTSVLGRALMAAAKREAAPGTALLTAVNHSGRSALTAAITGALVGARAGAAAFPPEWLAALDLTDLVQEVAEDAYHHFSRRNPHAENPTTWTPRYPEG